MHSQSEEIILHGADAVEAPIGISYRLDRLAFEETLRLELGVEFSAVLLVRGEIVFGQDDGLTSETVSQGVEQGPALAFGSYRPGGAGCVVAVDVRADEWSHVDVPHLVVVRAGEEACRLEWDVFEGTWVGELWGTGMQ